MRQSDPVNPGFVVREILRMSQKAIGFTLAMIGIGYIGGLVAIFFRPDLAGPLEQYASVFTPVWQLEIGVYGIGSTVEKIPSFKTKIASIGTDGDAQNG